MILKIYFCLRSRKFFQLLRRRVRNLFTFYVINSWKFLLERTNESTLILKSTCRIIKVSQEESDGFWVHDNEESWLKKTLEDNVGIIKAFSINANKIRRLRFLDFLRSIIRKYI